MFKICTKKYDHIFFSPHLDDVTLSCGGLITKLHKAKILVVTIFSGIDEGKTSNFGKQFIFLSGFNNARDFIESRKSEEKRVARFLGYDFLFLNYPDAIFRYNVNCLLLNPT